MWKFRGRGQIPQLGSNSMAKTVGPSDLALNCSTLVYSNNSGYAYSNVKAFICIKC